MKRIYTLPCLLVTLLVATPVLADDEPVIPDDKYVYCTVCHGVQMSGNVVIQAPRLSGMETWYLERQLQTFKNGWRGTHEEDTYGHEMRPMAAVLSEREMTEVSQFVNATASAAPELTVGGDASRGERLYTSCVACHGANAEGNKMLGGPALTGLNDWYLLTQLENFKSGVRGSAAGDTYGQQMKAASQLLRDEEAMQDVVRYIATIDSR